MCMSNLKGSKIIFLIKPLLNTFFFLIIINCYFISLGVLHDYSKSRFLVFLQLFIIFLSICLVPGKLLCLELVTSMLFSSLFL